MSSDSDCKKETGSLRSRLVLYLYNNIFFNNYIQSNFNILFLVVDGCTRTVVTTHQVCEIKLIVVKEKYVKTSIYSLKYVSTIK